MTTTSEKAAMDAAVRHLVSNYSPRGNRVGWLMMASILVEAWDLYAIAFVLILIRNHHHPSPCGLAGAGTQGGAAGPVSRTGARKTAQILFRAAFL
jgi:hypothetical protein